jgi:hypothetical protein
MSLEPHRAGGSGRIDAGLLPPSGFIATAMDLTVMVPAQRHSELIAYFSPECAVLREPQMVGIGWHAAANQARLFGHEPDVVSVTKAARLGMDQLALVDTAGRRFPPAGSGKRHCTDEDGWSAYAPHPN